MNRPMLCIVLLTTAFAFTGCGSEERVEIPYSPDFVKLVEGRNVNEVEVVQELSGVTYVLGQTKSGDAPGNFKVYIKPLDDSLRGFLAQHQVSFHVTTRKSSIPWQHAALPMVGLLIWISVLIFVLTLAVRLVRAVERIAGNTDR